MIPPEPISTSDAPLANAQRVLGRKPRLLFLAHRLPYPPDRGDRIRSYHLLKHLAPHVQLSIACTSEESVWLQHHQMLHAMADRVAILPISPLFSRLRAVAALTGFNPVTPAWHYRQGLVDTILQWHQQKPFDLVITFCTGMIRYARLLTSGHHGPTPKHILDLVDVDSLKWQSYAQRSWPPMRWVYAQEARSLRRIEAGLEDRLDAITLISDAEAQAYRQHVSDRADVTVVPNGVDLDYFSPQPDADQPTLAFVGVLNYKPNAQAVDWMARQVMPLLRRRVPQATFQVIGRHPTAAVHELAHLPDAATQIVGSVPDVRPFLRDAAVVVAPLQIARGVQNKVLEAMACQKPVVCSPGAAQGINATAGEHFLIADEPEAWVNQLAWLLTDAQARQRLALAARRRVESVYAWNRAVAPMLALIDRCLCGPSAA